MLIKKRRAPLGVPQNLGGKMEIGLEHRSKKIKLDVKKCGFFGIFRGLMFRRREKATALLFDFKKPRRLKIHSWFVFFPFLAVWLDDKNRILEIKMVKPWKFCVFPKKSFYKLVEIPCSSKYDNIMKFLDEDTNPKKLCFLELEKPRR